MLDRYLPLTVYKVFRKTFDKVNLAQNVELYDQITTQMSERLSVVKILGKLEEVNMLAETVFDIHCNIKDIKD